MKQEYTRNEIHNMLTMIQAGNEGNGGLSKCVSAYGVIGFVRFLTRLLYTFDYTSKKSRFIWWSYYIYH